MCLENIFVNLTSEPSVMEKYFKIHFEFDHDQLEQTIINTSLETKGYCCFIDSNTLCEAHKSNSEKFRTILNNSLVNSCDGSYIAMLASLVYKRHFRAYSGPQFFNKFVYHRVRHCFIGNTYSVFQKIRSKVALDIEHPDMHFISIPFKEVDEFDYNAIAREVNSLKPNYIWVSMGAPKQEVFMSKLLPHIDRGVMMGVGAALNYFSGEIKAIPHWAKKFNLIWFYRILTEPKKQIRRVGKILIYYPRVFF